ncbi:LamG-like jellyroll fold domain-containing protein [Pseudoalteromonas sp. S16_S37]|uniref:LamG-like jellyroll fold domain-containing protein n=1 Tax=Pseudoalteromonas sp. S16_S37 TaxID=2720228 RepID=UPI001680DE8E|nr:hypothetical protein [Pseudoalteromonas sp. S16_S37]
MFQQNILNAIRISIDEYQGVRFKDLYVCFKKRAVFKSGVDIKLPELSFRLLTVLLEHAPMPLQNEQLLELVWKDTVTGEDNVKQRVFMLRLALGQDENNCYITTQRGKGYYINTPLKWSKKPNAVSVTRFTWIVLTSCVLMAASSIAVYSIVNNKNTHITAQVFMDKQEVIRLTKNVDDLAFCLDGYDDYVEIADDDALDVALGDFSLTAWVRTEALGQRVIVDKRYENFSDTVQGYVLFVDEGRLGFQLADGNGGWYCEKPGASCTTYYAQKNIADGLWHHVGVVVDRDERNGISFFIDGEQTCRHDPRAHRGTLENDMPLRIGSRSSYHTGLFQGAIGEVALHHRVLSSSDIAREFASGNQRYCYSIASKGGLRTAER